MHKTFIVCCRGSFKRKKKSDHMTILSKVMSDVSTAVIALKIIDQAIAVEFETRLHQKRLAPFPT